MNEERMKQAYDRMSPDSQAEKRILNEILMKGDSYMEKKFTSQPVSPSRWAVIPAALALIAVIALGVFVIRGFRQSDQAMNAPDQDDPNGEVLTQDSNQDQSMPSDSDQEHEPMTLPEFGEPDGGCASQDTRPIDAPVAVVPLPETLNMDHLDNCMVAISLDKESVIPCAGGAYPAQMKVTVYTYDVYDMVDIGLLEVGDVIVINQQDVVVTKLERESYLVRINGGLDNGGYDLRTDDNGVYYETGYSDAKTLYAIGQATLPVSPEFVFTDSADPENQSVDYSLDDLFKNETLFNVTFTPDNTSIVIEDGVVTQMYRRYTP